jgi:serine/threonine-protein kinase
MRERTKYEKRVGTVVDGRWRIDSLLGWGSTSAVYGATHRNGQRAALKILHRSLCADAAITERFLREAGIANGIKHRAIVPVRDDGMTEDRCAYLVLELLEGETLDERLERAGGRIALEDFARIFEELMSAIAAVHAAGVVHRDLKPQNVFIAATGEVKLLDFGTARILDRAAGYPISAEGLVVGTASFMSPEQAMGSRDEVDAQSDVWSLGAMIFTLLSGEYVHVGRDSHARLLAAASKPARLLSNVAPSVDERVATVVDRALAFSKEERWPDVQSMRVAFRVAVVSSVPSMHDLKAFVDVSDDASSTAGVRPATSMPGTTASMPPSPFLAAPAEAAATAAPATDDESPPHSESEAPAVSSTQNFRRVSASVPVPALVAGFGAMAAAVLLVVFFMTGGDEPSRSAAAVSTTPDLVETAAPVAAPAPSFIVISAPDEPVEPKAKRTERRMSVSPQPRRATEAPATRSPEPPLDIPAAEVLDAAPAAPATAPASAPAPAPAPDPATAPAPAPATADELSGATQAEPPSRPDVTAASAPAPAELP